MMRIMKLTVHSHRAYFWVFMILVYAAAAKSGTAADVEPNSMREQIQQDWLRQAELWIQGNPPPPTTASDAAGAVDGKKDGKYAFHTGAELEPWWQVDLGASRLIARIVVFNRLDYAPGLHNADNLDVLVSSNGVDWDVCHQNRNQHFGGVSGAPPLEIKFSEPREARYLRLQVRSDKPVFFHLDEVEVFGSDDPDQNLARGCPANQSSLSPWSTNKLPPPLRATWPEICQHILQQGRSLANDLAAAGMDTTETREQLDRLQDLFQQHAAEWSPDQLREQYFALRWVVRRLALSNPLVQIPELLIVKRFTQETYPDICLNHMPWVSRPGGDICVLRWQGVDQVPEVRNVLRGQLGPGHVHGYDLDWEAKRIVFGYAKASSDQPTEGWLDRRTNYHLRRDEEPIHLFEVDVAGTEIRQLTNGEWSDLDPAILPNGEIVFVSERCGCSLQCNEFDKDETSCNLYVMQPDGTNIRRMSASKDGDYLPHCLDDGTIGYCRWEYQERGWAHIQSIWTIRPDGTGADALFKQHLNNPWALEDVRSIPGTGNQRLVGIAAGHHTLAAGPVVIVTPHVGMNDSRGIQIVTPDVMPPEGGMSGTPVPEGGVHDGGGYYMTPWALSDKYFLASYSFSAIQNEATGYGIYLIDVFGNKELIYRDPEISCFAPIPLRPRPRPPVVPPAPDLGQALAICAVADVTHGVEGIAPDRAKYIRIAERLVWPYDNQDGGQRYHEVPHTQQLVPNWTPVRIIGEVPVESDGSAHFQVPADTPVYFQLLDENHMELRRMRSFISLQPGEQRACLGCHETRGEAPRAVPVPMALQRAPSLPSPPPWGRRALSFLRDVQPVFDQHCVACHSGLAPAGGLDFSGGLTARGVIPAYGANRAYETIRVHDLVSRSNIHDDAHITAPLEFGSHRSKLVKVLRDGACASRVKLREQDWRRLVTWIDANAPYHSGFINKRSDVSTYDLPADTELLNQITAVHRRRCQDCHAAEEISRADWIDLRTPGESRFLTAPLAESAGGQQRCDQAVYANRDDPDYRALRKLVEDAVEKAWQYPRRDVASLK
jgi:hypothetical protein